MQKIRYIDAIFERDKKRKYYTEDALLLQDLLRYSSTINGASFEKATPFKLRELQNWIVRNNKQIVDYWNERLQRRNTPYSNRVHAMEGKINNKFEILLVLNLVRISGAVRAEKIRGLQVPRYEYSKPGILLALIIDGMNLISKERKTSEHGKQIDNILENIYELFNFVYKRRQDLPASDIFYSIYFQKCKDKGLFGKLVSRIHFILNWDYRIGSVPDLLERAIYDPFLTKQSQTDFIDLFYEAIEGLNQENRKLILYEIKTLAEETFKRKLEEVTHLTRPYEEFRFNLRGDYNRIAIEGYCEYCKSNRPVALNYLDLRRLSVANEKRADCPNCNTKGSLVISHF
jgi:hypothetical protein